MNQKPASTQILRGVGVFAILIAAIQFLLSGRMDLNSLSSHYIFLGINLLFNVLGIYSYKYWRELKTTRTFVSLSLLMVPVHMAQLGAFYLYQFNPQNSTIPNLLKLSLPDGSGLIVVSIVTFAVVISATILGFRILNREHAKSLIFSYLLGSFMFLLPFRTESFMGFGIGLLILESLITAVKLNTRKTPETRLSQLIVFIPSLILFARSFFYPIEVTFYIAIMFLLAIALYRYMWKLVDNESLAKFIQGSYALPLAFGLGQVAAWTSMTGLLAMIIFAIIIYCLSYNMLGKGDLFRYIASILTPFILVAVWADYGIIAEYISLLIPVSFMLVAYQFKEGGIFKLNFLTFILFFGQKTISIMSFQYLQNWYVLALLGAGIIFIAGFMERDLPRYTNMAKKIWNRFEES
ncbi:hypothetical protein N9N67_08045 [Bacteriovoracaceae bacterium]|nr:hypothetical protein [Bacteriovoracaceae bacterium]